MDIEVNFSRVCAFLQGSNAVHQDSLFIFFFWKEEIVCGYLGLCCVFFSFFSNKSRLCAPLLFYIPALLRKLKTAFLMDHQSRNEESAGIAFRCDADWCMSSEPAVGQEE